MNAKFAPSALLVSLSLALFGCGDNGSNANTPNANTSADGASVVTGELADTR